jgi:hypothetical protein
MRVRLRYRRLSETQGGGDARPNATLDTLTELFERLTQPGAHAGNLREEELRLAAAALLVHATTIDGEVAPEERRKLKALLQTHFDNLLGTRSWEVHAGSNSVAGSMTSSGT